MRHKQVDHVAGALAMVAQVALLMWMRTVMNYQHANGLSTWDGDWRSFAARLLGLVACVGLLMLVSGQLSRTDLGISGRLRLSSLGSLLSTCWCCCF